ncbi:undecaprenyl-phosphate glucose phosphotransferase [Mucilaginibacter sp.]|uniref:undecaprenyl-phosphate glucose phosphotransferase n=1 Tax=Mucilaginibacter sp. TaxID=1882438 RepID=UPI00284FE2B1|nr:undecaprenyl-phosphate glucose phosphotransferase [Mucilaginibacter sp.]MDR3697304.1 undecaprenyl-phosphate glucose phosphotransferase [Mucilaginibacter sp.]
MINRQTTFFKALNLAIDYIILNISMISIYFIEEGSSIYFGNNRRYLPIVLVFNLIWLLSANISGLYEQVLNKDSIKTYRVVIRTYIIFVSLICFTILILIGTDAYSITRQYLFYSLALFGFLLGLWKLIFLLIRRADWRSLVDTRDVIIIGAGRIGYDLFNFFETNPDKGYKTIGFFDDNPKNVKENQLYLGGTRDCIDYVIKNKVDEIFCTLPISEAKTIEKLMLDADKNLIRFKSVPEYFDYSKKTIIIQSLGHIPVISFRTEPLESLLNRSIKRLFDCVFALFVILFVFSWLFPILAILIKLESKGPVFFTQVRSGRDNHPFKCYKFRSMKVNNDSDHKQASRDDNRITRIGAFLRRTSLDELPQFFNVLKGNMSVVGPRPHMIKHTKQYSQLIDRFMVRHFLKPGITGWAQVQGLRGETKTVDAMLKRVEADVWYLENWSFLLDLRIIMLTVWNSLKGDDNAF